MQMPERKYEPASGYRYGFNGKEKDKDINSLTAYDYGFRIYNPGIGRFLSVDPLTKNYPSWSPYPFAMNRPIDGIDLDGLEYLQANSKNKYQKSLYRLHAYEDMASNYTLDNQIWITNTKIHAVVMNHPDNKNPPDGEDDSVPEVKTFEGKPKNTAKHTAYNRRQANYANRASGADIVIGLLELGIWIYTKAYEIKHKEDLDYGRTSLVALDKADRVLRAAVTRTDFPEKLKDGIIEKDLVNYITDGLLPSDGSLQYSLIIQKWGNLLFKNGEEILKGQYVFKMEMTVAEPHYSGDGNTGRRFTAQYKIGNPDEDLKAAWELIKDPVPVPQAQIKSSN